MHMCSISTDKYDIDISKLLNRRLCKLGFESILTVSEPNYSEVDVSDDESFDAFVNALSEVLVYDISQFTIADMVRGFPFSIEDRKTILTESIQYAKAAVLKSPVKRELATYFVDNNCLVLEGFVRFRMKDTLIILERCVDKATEEYLLRSERVELIELLSAFAQVNPHRTDTVSLILQPDGTCSVSDDSDSHIEYPVDSDENIISLLISLSPRNIVIYDLSGGSATELLITVYRIFEERVKVYRSIKV